MSSTTTISRFLIRLILLLQSLGNLLSGSLMLLDPIGRSPKFGLEDLETDVIRLLGQPEEPCLTLRRLTQSVF